MWGRAEASLASRVFTGSMTTSGDTPHDRHIPPSGGYPQQPFRGAVPALTAEERNWAVAAHVGSFLAAWVALGLLAPLVVLLAKGDESPYIRRHSVESLNFQINALIYTVVFAVLMLVVIGFVLLPLYGIFYAVCVIIGTVRASHGEEFRYPLTIRFVS